MRLPESHAKLEQGAFEAIAALAHREFGLHIAPEKMKMVQSRLRHRLSELNLTDFNAYSDLVCSTQGDDEKRCMISALKTNVSHFFREPHHFELLSEHMLPNLPERIAEKDRIRIWSAGCSNGQEPYSIAMHMIGEVPSISDTDFKILATDVDPKVVAFAREGIYENQTVSGIPSNTQKRFLHADGNSWRVSKNIRDHISFRELNLLAQWPMQHQFDAIFCRNVVIYFDVATQEELWPRFYHMLKPDGLLLLGHSERIGTPAQFGFKTIGTTAYQKIDGAVQRSSINPGGFYGAS